MPRRTAEINSLVGFKFAEESLFLERLAYASTAAALTVVFRAVKPDLLPVSKMNDLCPSAGGAWVAASFKNAWSKLRVQETYEKSFGFWGVPTSATASALPGSRDREALCASPLWSGGIRRDRRPVFTQRRKRLAGCKYGDGSGAWQVRRGMLRSGTGRRQATENFPPSELLGGGTKGFWG